MKKILVTLLIVQLYFSASCQFVARLEIKDNDTIQGLCDRKNVYTLFPMFKGQQEATCSELKDDIQERLNNEVAYLKTNPGKNDKGMISIIINCKGEVVRCETDNKTKNEELDKQILAIFKTLKTWRPGKLDGKEVDSVSLWSFEIKKGKIVLT